MSLDHSIILSQDINSLGKPQIDRQNNGEEPRSLFQRFFAPVPLFGRNSILIKP